MSWRNHRFLRFTCVDPLASGKTRSYAVHSRSGDELGFIEWYAPWRQYTFDPEFGATFNSGCLDGLSAFLTEATANRVIDITGEAQ